MERDNKRLKEVIVSLRENQKTRVHILVHTYYFAKFRLGFS